MTAARPLKPTVHLIEVLGTGLCQDGYCLYSFSVRRGEFQACPPRKPSLRGVAGGENIKSLPLACRRHAIPREFACGMVPRFMRHCSAGKGHLLLNDRLIRPDR